MLRPGIAVAARLSRSGTMLPPPEQKIFTPPLSLRKVRFDRGKKLVLIYYLCADFQSVEKPKGVPWKSKFFLLKGVLEGS